MAGGDDELSEGIAAYNRGDYVTARDDLAAAIDRGNAEAMVDLGYMYARGQAVGRDSDQHYACIARPRKPMTPRA